MNADPSSISLDAIEQVEFFKRDEITTDLVCCEIVVRKLGGNETWFFHEEASSWEDALRLVERLPGFDANWPAKVMQPPFAENRIVAFRRSP